MVEIVLGAPRLFWAWTDSANGHANVAALAAAFGVILVLRIVSIGMRRNGAFNERVLIVGSSPIVNVLVDEIEHRPESRYVVIGVVDDAPTGRPTPGLSPRLGSLVRLREIIENTRPARIVLAPSDRRPVSDELLLNSRIQGIAIEEAINFYERVTGKLAIEALTPRSLILSEGFRHSDFVPSDFSMAITRGLSFLCAAAGLLLLAPVFAAIAILIRLESPGPVFFVQERIGRGGRPFGLLKFRTMRQDAGQRSLWVRDNVDRITRVGRWLRRFRLDEMPQFLNVLCGEMSLVGPRPHPTANYRLFMKRIPYYGLRAAVRPGITGWAQVKYGYANSLEEETEKMRYDLFYIKHRSLWLDVRILVRTARVLLFEKRSHETVHQLPAAWHDKWHGSATGAAS